MARPPRFSVVTPVYETPEDLLVAAIASVEAQSCSDWELVLADDGSTSPHVHRVLDEAAARDRRIRVIRRPQNGGIVAASNDALAAARGTFIALFDHDDLLHRDALSTVAETLDHWAEVARAVRKAEAAKAAEAEGDGDGDDDNRHHKADGDDDVDADYDPDETHEVDYLYTDEDKVDLRGRHSQAFRKPDWSPDRLRCQPYTCHLSVIRRSLVEELGGFRDGFDGSQDFDLVLRVTERAREIVHVREVLYHWRIFAGSTAADANAKPYAWDNGVKAIDEHCARTGFEATAKLAEMGRYALTPRLRAHPLVSIVIPTAAQFREIHGRPVLLAEQCVRGIAERSTYDNYEIVLVYDDHVDEGLRRRIEAAAPDRVRSVVYREPFNFSDKCNVGAILGDGDHLLFLNDDTDVITPHWIESLLMYSRAPGVGGVGARLLYGDGRVQHAGVGILGDVFAHIYAGFAGSFHGYFEVALIPCNYLAVTAACLMTPRAAFEEVGGFSVDLPVNFNDVDFCLKLFEAGYRVVYDANCELRHHESSTRKPKVDGFEVDILMERWRTLERDPYMPADVINVNYAFPRWPTSPDKGHATGMYEPDVARRA
jgi:GT2 family glycosyltransferase